MRQSLLTFVAAYLCLGCTASAPPTDAPSVMTVPPASASTAAPTATGTQVSYASSTAASAPPGATAVEAGPGPIFRPSNLDTPTGDIEIFLTAPAVAPDVQGATHGHNIGIRGLGTLDIIATSDYLKAGDDPLVFSVSGLAPGKYVFVCEFPGHADAGMRGTLTVGP